jgi:quercetin dioxygenase-like cupin family protein
VRLVNRLVRLWTEAGQSRFGVQPLSIERTPATRIYLEETPAGSSLDWHDAPHRQYVITLSGTLRFTTRDNDTFELAPGDVLRAEDTAGGGHRWRLIDDQPWRRIYVELTP